MGQKQHHIPLLHIAITKPDSFEAYKHVEIKKAASAKHPFKMWILKPVYHSQCTSNNDVTAASVVFPLT